MPSKILLLSIILISFLAKVAKAATLSFDYSIASDFYQEDDRTKKYQMSDYLFGTLMADAKIDDAVKSSALIEPDSSTQLNSNSKRLSINSQINQNVNPTSSQMALSNHNMGLQVVSTTAMSSSPLIANPGSKEESAKTEMSSVQFLLASSKCKSDQDCQKLVQSLSIKLFGIVAICNTSFQQCLFY